MSIKKQGGFAQVAGVLLLVVGLLVGLAAVSQNTNFIPFAHNQKPVPSFVPLSQLQNNKNNDHKSQRNGVVCDKNGNCVLSYSNFQSPAPLPAGAVLGCVYQRTDLPAASPYNTNPQTANNPACPANWTCAPNGKSFAGIKFGDCTPPVDYDASKPIACTPSTTSIFGSGCPNVGGGKEGPNWACAPYNGGGACVLKNGVNIVPAATTTTQGCTPSTTNAQSDCPSNNVCVPGPTGGTCRTVQCSIPGEGVPCAPVSGSLDSIGIGTSPDCDTGAYCSIRANLADKTHGKCTKIGVPLESVYYTEFSQNPAPQVVCQ